MVIVVSCVTSHRLRPNPYPKIVSYYSFYI